MRGATIDITTTSLYAQDRWALSTATSRSTSACATSASAATPPAASSASTPTRWCRVSPRATIPCGNGKWLVQATYAHYAGKYSEAQFSSNTNVGNPSRTLGIYTGPAGQGLDFAPGFDPANYETFVGIFPTANVFFDDGLSSPVTKEFTTSLGVQLGQGYRQGRLRASQHRASFVEDFIDLTTGQTDVTFEGVDYGTFQNRVFRNTDEPKRRYRRAGVPGPAAALEPLERLRQLHGAAEERGQLRGRGDESAGHQLDVRRLSRGLHRGAALPGRASRRLPASQAAPVDDLSAGRRQAGQRRRRLGVSLRFAARVRPACRRRVADRDPGGAAGRLRQHAGLAEHLLRRARVRALRRTARTSSIWA